MYPENPGVCIVEKTELKKAMEAILFVMGEPVEIKRLSAALGVSEGEVRQSAAEMMLDMEASHRGVTLIEVEDSLQMCTRKDAYGYIIKIISVPRENRLTDVQLETLSIIAYKQPVTKLEIEAIRGVNTDYAVNRLVEYGLVEEKGRLNAPGRPFQFGTTQEFLKRFGLKNLDELPRIDEQLAEGFAREAQSEAAFASSDDGFVET